MTTNPRHFIHGVQTPWGRADLETDLGTDGIFAVSTPSHGGIYVPSVMLDRIPEAHQLYAARWSGSRNWYEEDCAWAYVALAFPELFTAGQLEDARTTAKWLSTPAIDGGPRS